MDFYLRRSDPETGDAEENCGQDFGCVAHRFAPLRKCVRNIDAQAVRRKYEAAIKPQAVVNKCLPMLALLATFILPLAAPVQFSIFFVVVTIHPVALAVYAIPFAI